MSPQARSCTNVQTSIISCTVLTVHDKEERAALQSRRCFLSDQINHP